MLEDERKDEPSNAEEYLEWILDVTNWDTEKAEE